MFFSFTACYWSREGHQHKFTLGLASFAAGLKCVGNMGFHGVIVSTPDSQVRGSSSVGFCCCELEVLYCPFLKNKPVGITVERLRLLSAYSAEVSFGYSSGEIPG